MTATERWREANLARWEEMAALHPATELYDVEGLIAGRDDLRPWEDAELGPVSGLDLVHLQCHIGTDTLGWARRGARVVGVDFSPTALDTAAEVAERSGGEIEWVCCDPSPTPGATSGCMRSPMCSPPCSASG